MASNRVSSYRFAHLSDPHLPPPPFHNGWRDWVSKRSLSRFAWRRKGKRHQPHVLAAVVADIQAYAPDHIVVTGDLTNFSTPEEVAAAGRWLSTLGPGDDVTVSPGNHDALTGRRDHGRFDPWRPWLGDGPFPTVRERGDIAVVNLCSATPTAPHLAQGELGPAQIARLEEVLGDLGRRGLYRLILIHHPVTSTVVSKRKSLVDGPSMREVLKRVGAELILHGHAHETAVTATPGPNGPIPILGVPSASVGMGFHDEPARWHGLEVERTADGFATRVVARGLSGTGQLAEIGRYTLVHQR